MTDGEAQKKKGGRPRLYPGTEKRPTLTFRVRGRMHEQLTKAAEEGGRSLSEEIERRLDQSFTFSEIIQQSAESATRTFHRDRFGSREVFESSELYGQILTGLIARLQKKSGPNEKWCYPIEDSKSYLKQQILERVDGLVEVLFVELALKYLQGPDKYEADAFLRERSIPREIGGAYLTLQAHKHAIRHKLLPHIMDAMELEGTESEEEASGDTEQH